MPFCCAPKAPSHPLLYAHQQWDIVTRMEDLILYKLEKDGACAVEDFRAAGFPDWQIAAFGEIALGFAVGRIKNAANDAGGNA